MCVLLNSSICREVGNVSGEVTKDSEGVHLEKLGLLWLSMYLTQLGIDFFSHK